MTDNNIKKQPETFKSFVSVWTNRPYITKKDVEKITRKASWHTRLRLVFVPSQYSIDGKSIIRFKQLKGITYVIRRGTKL